MLTEAEKIAALDRVVASVDARKTIKDMLTAGSGIGVNVKDKVGQALVEGIAFWQSVLDMPSWNTAWTPPPDSNEVFGHEKEVVYGLLWRQHPGHRLFAMESTEWQDKYICSCRQVLRFSKGVVEDALRYGNPR